MALGLVIMERDTFVSKQLSLGKMQAGQSGVVAEIDGGQRLRKRLDAMGIRPGKRITKISSMMLRGAVTLQVGNSQVAIGFGMANKILVDVNGSS